MSDRLFELLPPAVRDRALARFRPLSVPQGTEILNPYAHGPGAMYIREGRISIEREGLVIDESGPGELVGELSLFTGRSPIATLRAVEPTEVLVLDAKSYTALHADGSEVAHRFERLAILGLARRLRRLDQLIAERSQGESSPYFKPPPGAFERIRTLLFGGPETPIVRPRPRHPVEILYDSRAFRHLDPDVRTAIAKEMKLEAVPPGTFLCTQGEAGDAMYLLAYGHVEVYVALENGLVHKLGEINDGTMFGITALMDDRPRMASCVARDKVDVLVLSRERWKAIAAESTVAASALRVAVITAFADQVEEAGRNLIAVAQGKSPPAGPAGSTTR